MKKKALIAALILLITGAIVLGTVLILNKMKDSRPFVERTDPQIEYISLTSGGGISGHYDKEIKAYQDGSGYHLYYRYNGEEETYDLTKSEYLICTNYPEEYFNELQEAEEVRGADLIYESVDVKFIGKDSFYIRGKAYSGQVLTALRYYATVKANGIENREFYAIQTRVSEYLLEHKVSVAGFRFQLKTPSSDTYSGNLCFWEHLDITGEELADYRATSSFLNRLSDPKLGKEDFKEIKIHGKTAYYITHIESNMISVALTIPDDTEVMTFYSTPPEGMSLEKYLKVMTELIIQE